MQILSRTGTETQIEEKQSLVNESHIANLVSKLNDENYWLVLSAAVQTSFTEFRGQKNFHRLKLRHTGRSLM